VLLHLLIKKKKKKILLHFIIALPIERITDVTFLSMHDKHIYIYIYIYTKNIYLNFYKEGLRKVM
jgi:hypothetical protein